ncbi:Protein canopy-1 [Morella rubra]|uniref:Protein canopy-1 n=1 Tax=Morella rubra TaxID=262757 RepID=A0A6A1UV00_9ROSI|nr:Protein canopy-1 [Morella rubra]
MAKSKAWLLLTLFAVFSVASCVDDKCAACNAVAEEIEISLSNEKPRNHLDMRHRLDSKGQRKGKVIDYRVSELRVVELLDGLCEKMQDYTLQKIDSTRKEWVKVDDWDNITTNKQEARAYSKAMSSYCGRLLEETEDDMCNWVYDLLTSQTPYLASLTLHDNPQHLYQRPVQNVFSRKAYKQEARAYSKAMSSYCGRLLEETEDDLGDLIKKGSVKVGGVSKILCQDLSKHCSQTGDFQKVDGNYDGSDGEL